MLDASCVYLVPLASQKFFTKIIALPDVELIDCRWAQQDKDSRKCVAFLIDIKTKNDRKCYNGSGGSKKSRKCYGLIQSNLADLIETIMVRYSLKNI